MFIDVVWGLDLDVLVGVLEKYVGNVGALAEVGVLG